MRKYIYIIIIIIIIIIIRARKGRRNAHKMARNRLRRFKNTRIEI
jgi:hypothetical protein